MDSKVSKKIENQSPLSKRLKEARTKIGISQKNLGILAGIDEFSASARVNQYEKGKHAPEFSMSKRLAVVLNIPTSYLYEEDDDVASMLMQYYKLNEQNRKIILEKIESIRNSSASDQV